VPDHGLSPRSVATADGQLAPIEYEPGLIEESVRWMIDQAAPGIPSLKLQRLRLNHRLRLDAIYGLPEGEERESAFRDHFMALFHELGTASWIPRWLELFPRLRSDLECVLLRAATGPGEEGAELWESREQRGKGVPAYLVITVAAAGLRHHDDLRALLLPDLLRAADRIDPDFGFRGEDLTGSTRAEQERLREVYQRLWEVSARSRLRSRGLIEDSRLVTDLLPLVANGAHTQGDTAGGCVPSAEDLLATLTEDPSHERFLSVVCQLPGGTETRAGGASARCPLCRYPTMDWAPDGALPALETAICADYPDWRPADGCCGHCAERYEMLAEAQGAHA